MAASSDSRHDKGDQSDCSPSTHCPTIGNEAPVITSNGGGAAASINVAENNTAVTTVTATDVDAGQTLTYSISGGADAAKFAELTRAYARYPRVRLANALVAPDDVVALLEKHGVPRDFGVLSLDIDSYGFHGSETNDDFGADLFT